MADAFNRTEWVHHPSPDTRTCHKHYRAIHHNHYIESQPLMVVASCDIQFAETNIGHHRVLWWPTVSSF